MPHSDPTRPPPPPAVASKSGPKAHDIRQPFSSRAQAQADPPRFRRHAPHGGAPIRPQALPPPPQSVAHTLFLGAPCRDRLSQAYLPVPKTPVTPFLLMPECSAYPIPPSTLAVCTHPSPPLPAPTPLANLLFRQACHSYTPLFTSRHSLHPLSLFFFFFLYFGG